jgi:hypothetical protein
MTYEERVLANLITGLFINHSQFYTTKHIETWGAALVDCDLEIMIDVFKEVIADETAEKMPTIGMIKAIYRREYANRNPKPKEEDVGTLDLQSRYSLSDQCKIEAIKAWKPGLSFKQAYQECRIFFGNLFRLEEYEDQENIT